MTEFSAEKRRVPEAGDSAGTGVRYMFNRFSFNGNGESNFKVGEDFGSNLPYGFSFKASVFGDPQVWDRLKEIAIPESKKIVQYK